MTEKRILKSLPENHYYYHSVNWVIFPAQRANAFFKNIISRIVHMENLLYKTMTLLNKQSKQTNKKTKDTHYILGHVPFA